MDPGRPRPICGSGPELTSPGRHNCGMEQRRAKVRDRGGDRLSERLIFFSFLLTDFRLGSARDDGDRTVKRVDALDARGAASFREA
jgi:hypothetical protein